MTAQGSVSWEAERSWGAKGDVASVSKALAILAFVGENGSVGLSDLERAFDIPKSTLFRMLATLCHSGFIARHGQAEYTVTVKLWRLGATSVKYEEIHRDVGASLRSLVEESSETAHYSVYETGHAVYVDKVEGLHAVRAYTEIGGRSPAHASATGKALLAFQHPDEIQRVASQAQRYTETTVVGIDALLPELEHVREAGFAVNRGEWRPDVWGVAAPVFGPGAIAEAAIGVSGPHHRVEPLVEAFGSLARRAAASLTERRGGVAPTRGTA